jgi:hypothetical protein
MLLYFYLFRAALLDGDFVLAVRLGDLYIVPRLGVGFGQSSLTHA